MLYYKIINGQTKISDCRTIRTEAGVWVSNPSSELIASEGWLPYNPPAPPEPDPITEPDTYEVMEAVKRMLASSVESLTDEEALQVAALYPTWASKVGESVAVGERLWYNEKLYKVVQAHTVQEDWTPDVSTSLFTEVSVDPWPEFVQPTGASDAYMAGDQVTYNGQHYVCLMDNCVFSPDAYPAGWQLAED